VISARDASIDRWLRGLAQRELATPGRYQLSVARPAPVQAPWWMPTWRWLAGAFYRLWKAVAGRVHIGPSAVRGIGDVLLVAIVVVVIYVAIRLIRGVVIARATPTAAEPLDARPDPVALYRDACDAATRGEYGNAAVMLFAATVALLDVRGAIAGRRSATVGDLRRELRAGHAQLVPAFDAVAAPFVEKAYAERSVEAPQWQRARTAFDRVILRQAQDDGAKDGE
jgi:hypothetical protein